MLPLQTSEQVPTDKHEPAALHFFPDAHVVFMLRFSVQGPMPSALYLQLGQTLSEHFFALQFALEHSQIPVAHWLALVQVAPDWETSPAWQLVARRTVLL